MKKGIFEKLQEMQIRIERVGPDFRECLLRTLSGKNKISEGKFISSF